MSQINQSFAAEAWAGLSGPFSHIFPWLGSNFVSRNHFAGSLDTGFAGTGVVWSQDVVMADPPQIFNVTSNANFDDIEGWAPRIFLTDSATSNGGIFFGALNLPWGAVQTGNSFPFQFGTTGNNQFLTNILGTLTPASSTPKAHQNTFDIGFVLHNDSEGVNARHNNYTAVGSTTNPNPYLMACLNRRFFQGNLPTHPRVVWKVKARCCRIFNIEFIAYSNNIDDLTTPDQGQQSSVTLALHGTDANGSIDGSGLGNTVAINETTTIDNVFEDASATGYKRTVQVPFLYQGYERGNHFNSLDNVLSNVTDNVAGGYTYDSDFTPFPLPASIAQHQAQYDALQAQLTGSGWTEIEFYCSFAMHQTMDGLCVQVGNNTQISSVLFDYISLTPLNISPRNIYEMRDLATFPALGLGGDGGGFSFTQTIRTGAVPLTVDSGFSFDDDLD